MSPMTSGGVPRDGREQLADEIVSYWDGGTFVVQTGRGELIAASDTVAEVTR